MALIGSVEHPPGTSAGPAELSAADRVLHEPEQGMSEVVEGLAGHFGLTPRAAARTGQGELVVSAESRLHGWRNATGTCSPLLSCR
ncbi:hypothetical protein P1P68_04990 [Streptomyces scabiei]|uniref:hypothetical protein n=1 Tax=Streptomyces scabiei TaxID=1930 RepID=UPI0029900A90|nr:hypothetical protein [Streptomyces scabiei]MDW8804163.1 hypothetical protein [Streptomyces scabiei]